MKSALTTVLITLLTLETVQTSSDKYKKVGDTVVLSPGSVSANIESITWKHNSNLAVEWYGDEIDFYPKFKDRCTLNTTTGELTFLSVTLEDSGSYTAEINNRVMNPIEILVISEVPTPTVSESCDAEKTHCVLTCEGITTDAEPVNYTWRSGDVMKSETKELNITKEEKEPSFFCKIENPVSFESSKEVLNPFITTGNNKNSLNGLLMLPVVGVIVAVIVGVFIYKHITGKYPPRLRRVRSRLKTNAEAASSETSPNTENLPLQSLQSNGAAQPLVVVETVNEALIDVNNDPARLQQ